MQGDYLCIQVGLILQDLNSLGKKLSNFSVVKIIWTIQLIWSFPDHTFRESD